MSGDRSTIIDQHHIHFLTFTVVNWIDVFTRPTYKDILVKSLNYCIEEKGLQCYAWVIMSNHIHLIASCNKPQTLSGIIRDFKKFTSKAVVSAVHDEPESRKEWMLHKFRHEAQSTQRAEQYKLWQDGYHAVCLEGDGTRMKQRIDYIHNNPVRQMIVADAMHYLYSSAGDYCGFKGMVDVIIAG